MNLTNAERTHLNRAIKAAAISTMKNRHGATMAQGRKVLAVGVNTYRAHPTQVADPKTDSSWHAEVVVLRQRTHFDNARSVLYVARLNKLGRPVMSAPCEYCRRAIREAGIRKVVFTTDTGYGIYFDE